MLICTGYVADLNKILLKDPAHSKHIQTVRGLDTISTWKRGKSAFQFEIYQERERKYQ